MNNCGSQCPMEHKPTVSVNNGVMKFCAISRERFIGPYSFEQDRNIGEDHWNMLWYYMLPRLWSLIEHLIFHQYSAPPIYSSWVQAYLLGKIPESCIQEGRPVSGPPRFPDLTTRSLFSWRHIRSKIHGTSIGFVGELNIIRAKIIKNISEIFKKVQDNLQLRLDCITQQKGYI